MDDLRVSADATPPTRPLGRREGGPLDGPVSWREAFVGIGVFLTAIVAGALSLLPSVDSLWPAVNVVTIVAVFAGLALGWRKGFPRWSVPYLAFAVVALATWSTPGLTPLGLPPWLPLALTAAGLLLITRSAWPLWSLARGFWRDWTLLAFALYTIETTYIGIAFDEIEPPYEAAGQTLLLALMALGALGYMRGRTTARRFASLVGVVAACGLIENLGSGLYWSRYSGGGFTYDYLQVAYSLPPTLTFLLAPLFLPALLGLARLASYKRTAAPTG